MVHGARHPGLTQGLGPKGPGPILSVGRDCTMEEIRTQRPLLVPTVGPVTLIYLPRETLGFLRDLADHLEGVEASEERWRSPEDR